MRVKSEGMLFAIVFGVVIATLLSLTALAHTLRSRNSTVLPKPQVAALVTSPQTYYPTGDCNGDNKVDAGDLSAIALEIEDGDGNLAVDVGDGSFAGTAGCDADANGIIDQDDTSCITGIIFNDPNAYCTPNPNQGCVADINQDGIVDISDYSVLARSFLKTNPLNARVDISGDSVVDLSDFGLLQQNFFKTCN